MPTIGNNPAVGRIVVQPTFLQWGSPGIDPLDRIGELHFDAILEEDHDIDTDVTEHAVEEGSNIVDHVRPQCDRFNMVAFVTQTPVSSDDGLLLPLVLDIPQPGPGSFLAGGTSALLASGVAALGFGPAHVGANGETLFRGYPTQITARTYQYAGIGGAGGEANYVKAANDQLIALRDSATLITVTTPNRVYNNMIISKIGMKRNPQIGQAAQFELSFREIRIVSSKIVEAPNPSIVNATQKVQKGKKDAITPKDSDETVAHYLKRAGIGGILGGGL